MPRKRSKLRGNRWNPAFELTLIDQWTDEPYYKFSPKPNQEIFVIDTPPVYPSGDWHIGATAAYCLLDMIARFERMRGKAVYFPFCLDRNGINIELTVERKYAKQLHEFDREEFIQLCRETIEPYSQEIIHLSKRIGMSADYSLGTYYETDSAEYRAFSQACFIELWKRGLVYEDHRPIYFCPECGTSIAEAEIYYEEAEADFAYLKFQVKGTNEQLLIATTRPELLCACQAILVHPDDGRYAHLHAKTALTPYYSKEVPILPHHSAKPEFGTGVVMVCSYGDLTDVQIFREFQLKPIVALDEQGRMTEASGKFQGMPPAKARRAIIELLLQLDLIAKIESSTHKIPICERSRTPIELISLNEWYIKQKDFANTEIYSLIPKMEFLPSKNAQILIDWAKAVTIDWPISRRRFFHTEIPLWYCKECKEPLVPEPGKYYRPWCEPAPFKECPECGSPEFEGETRVFDTWVDSSISNLFVTRYLQDSDFFQNNFPCSLRPQGRDIVRTWLFYTILRSLYHANAPAFEKVWIHGMGLDEHGQAMSKSRGNVLHPGPTLDEIGADAFRLWAASETNHGEDFRISKPRMIGAQKFLTKFWNIARFISALEPVEEIPPELHPSDQWILVELKKLVADSENGYSQYNFFQPATKSRTFIREILASHYIEMVKYRAYDGDHSAIFTLHYVLRTLLQFLAPIIPFTTDIIYREIYGETVHSLSFPKIDIELPSESQMNNLTETLLAFNSKIWKTKKEQGIALNAGISGIEIPSQLLTFKADLEAMHKLA
ncbi:MAG: valine--tRNA ligase [Candidatus Hodarchaeota archaeon]